MQERKLVTQMLKQAKDKDGTSLFDHLSIMLAQLPSGPLNNMEHFELLSDFLKKHKFQFKQLPSQHQITELVLADRKTKYKWVESAQGLTKQTKKIPTQDTLVINNFSADSRLFQWAGIGFDQRTSEHLHMSVKKLAMSVKAKRMRFWGKIQTREQDYYVIQGFSQKVNNTDLAVGMEKVGEGANYYTFWVTHNYLEEWYELPLITPQQLRASKQIKHILTGNLEGPVKAYPNFPGVEKHLLKCQLVRITHCCEIAPKGLYASTEENPDDIDFTEDFKFPDVSELTNLENWVHLNQYLLQQGRCSYYIDQSLPEEQREAITTELNEKDPKIERLKGINQDKPSVEGLEVNWLAKVVGDTQVFNNVGKEQGTTSSYAVCTVRNLSWPGWLTVGNSKQYSSIYIGNGIKWQQQLFFPIGPSDLLQEGQDIQQFGEPNPKQPPDEIEPDSDEENKKEQS